MAPTYHNMQFTLIDKCNSTYSYGDVIAFRCERLDTILVKRIVACPGDVVLIKDGTLYVNGSASVVFPNETTYFSFAGTVTAPSVLGSDEFFVIGDNYELSKDSRYEEVGPVKRNDIYRKIL